MLVPPLLLSDWGEIGFAAPFCAVLCFLMIRGCWDSQGCIWRSSFHRACPCLGQKDFGSEIWEALLTGFDLLTSSLRRQSVSATELPLVQPASMLGRGLTYGRATDAAVHSSF